MGQKWLMAQKLIYILEDITLQITTHCTKPPTANFRTGIGFNQLHITISKEQSLSIKIIRALSQKKTLLYHSVLIYRIDLYVPVHKFAVKIYEKRRKERNEHKEVEKGIITLKNNIEEDKISKRLNLI